MMRLLTIMSRIRDNVCKWEDRQYEIYPVSEWVGFNGTSNGLGHKFRAAILPCRLSIQLRPLRDKWVGKTYI